MKFLSLFCCLFFCIALYSMPLYAEDASVSKKVSSYYDKTVNNEFVSGITSSLKSGWESFKKWFAKLPGIKQYNESVYSGKNWKKTMNSMGNEYSVHLKKDGAGAKLLRNAKKQFDN